MVQNQGGMSFEDCYTYVQEKVFPLRPVDYAVKYPQWPGLVGIELEMLPLWAGPKDSTKPRQVQLFGQHGLSGYLESLQASQSAWNYKYAPGEAHYLLNIALEDQDQLTFEPGGQLEFSTRPYPCLLDALRRVRDIQGILDEAAKAFGLDIIQIGMNPWATVDEIGLQMTKPRYQAMTSYYGQYAPEGLRMMRQTCTIQVNLDFGNCEETMAKRYLASNLLAPMATAIFANSPFMDGRATDRLSNRGWVWQKMDRTHTGFPDLEGVVRSMDRRACVEAYLHWMLNGHVVFIQDLDHRVMDGRFSFRDWVRDGFEGYRPQVKDIQTHLSLQFPEVRARGFIELRSMDCQARFWQAVPAAFYTGLLYDPTSLNAVLDELLPVRDRLADLWKQCVYGLKDPELARLAKRVGELSVEGFRRLPSCFQGEDSLRLLEVFLDRYTFQGRSPAHDLLDKARAQPEGIVSVGDMEALQAVWQSQMTRTV